MDAHQRTWFVWQQISETEAQKSDCKWLSGYQVILCPEGDCDIIAGTWTDGGARNWIRWISISVCPSKLSKSEICLKLTTAHMTELSFILCVRCWLGFLPWMPVACGAWSMSWVRGELPCFTVQWPDTSFKLGHVLCEGIASCLFLHWSKNTWAKT